MIPRLIFLDHDGVLNRHGISRHDSGLEPYLVHRIRRLVLATNARVVSSTAWRAHYTTPELRELLHALGLRREWILDATPILRDQTRGAEIAAWLEADARPVRFVVLDDNDAGRFDMDPIRAHFVQTHPGLGVTEADIRRASQLLTAGPVWLANTASKIA